MSRLIFLMGLPGSGKSTLARSLVERRSRRRLIATDTIRAKLYGDEAIQGHWGQIWHEATRQLAQAARDCPEVAAVYDATNARRRARRDALADCRQLGFTWIFGVWVDTPLELCLQRNRDRPRQVPEAVIYRMSRQLQGAPPALSDGFDRLLYYRLGRSEYGKCDRPRMQEPNSTTEKNTLN